MSLICDFSLHRFRAVVEHFSFILEHFGISKKTLDFLICDETQSIDNLEVKNRIQKLQKAIDENETIIVGVNKFQSKNENENPTQKIDQKSVENQLSRLKKLKENRKEIPYYSNTVVYFLKLAL